MTCNNCGNSSEYNINYCINCGNKILSVDLKQTVNKKSNKTSNKIFIVLASLMIIVIGVVVYFLIGITPTKNRTIMVYINGNNIESDNIYSINDIFPKEFDDKNINVVFIADGSKKFLNFLEDDSVGIYEYKNNKVKLLKAYDNLTLGQKEAFENFINFSTKKFRSENYDLIFWDHGVSSISSDTIQIDNDVLDILEIKAGLSNSKFNQENKLEYVNFISSVSANYENALILSNYANYMIASEEILYESKDFINIYDLINVGVTDNPVDINKKFITNYRNAIEKKIGEYDYSQTYSIIDLTKMALLNQIINEFFSSIDLSDLTFKEISRARARVSQYGFNQSNYEYIDICNFMEKLRDKDFTKTINVIDALADTIVYNVTSQDKYAMNYSKGLSIYFPRTGDKDYITKQLAIYEQLELNEYVKFINEFLNKMENGKNANNYTFKSTLNPKVDDMYMMIFEGDLENNFASSTYGIYKKVNDNYYLIYSSGEWSLMGSNIFDVSTSVYELKINDNQSNIYLKQLYYSANEDSFIIPVKLYKNDTDYINANIIYNIEDYFGNLDRSAIGSIIPAINNSGYLLDLSDYKYLEFEVGAFATDETGQINLSDYRIIDKLKYETSKFKPEVVEVNGDNYNILVILEDVYGDTFGKGPISLQKAKTD